VYYYVVNPAAGGGRINKIQEELRETLRDLGIGGEFVKTLGPEDVDKVTKSGLAAGHTTIVAIGGDGTVSEVLRTLAGHEDVALGIIPLGNSNHLARLLGIPDYKTACQILASRKIEEVDVGRIGNRFFVSSVGIGFEAQALQEGHVLDETRGTRLKRLPSYLSLIRKFQPAEVTLNIDDKYQVKAPAFNINISNSRSSSQFSFALSNPQDNRLDVAILSKFSTGQVLGHLPDYLQGQLHFSDDVSLFRAKKVEIESNEPLPVHVDGEVIGSTPTKVWVARQKMRLIVGKDRTF
jgi:YegS/Rv2252/BmrU family lipid kinase